MKHTKDRVIAIDYFRGICILMVILNHSMVFSLPFAYLAGASSLWTSAAEMFLLLSGLTLGIVRGEAIVSDFKTAAKKIWRRSAITYLLYISTAVLSLLMALFLVAHHLPNDVLGSLPSSTGLSLLWSIVNLSYGIGWAGFIMIYAVFLVFAPFALYSLKTRYWGALPLVSLTIFVVNYSNPNIFGAVSNLAMWQLYFVMGMVLSKARAPVIGRLYGLSKERFRLFRTGIMSAAFIVLAINILLNFNISPVVARLVNDGWLPVKLQSAYIRLLDHRTIFDITLMNSRTGVLRPVITLLFLAASYLLYQKHKNFLLNRTGSFVNAMGRDTLWIFVAQAFAIPLLVIVPLHRNPFNNFLLTATLIMLMWSLTKRRGASTALRQYGAELRASYNAGKYDYIYRSQDSN